MPEQHGPPGPITPPAQLRSFGDYWWERMQGWIDAGLLHKSGVQCPSDTLELWTTATGVQGLTVQGDRPVEEFPTKPAICANGHQWRL